MKDSMLKYFMTDNKDAEDNNNLIQLSEFKADQIVNGV